MASESIWQRIGEWVVCACVLIVLTPVLLLISACVLIDTGRPILFRQTRVGRNGVPFHLLKFRTMCTQVSGLPITVRSDHRITRTGRLLRKIKLDELPQLWNVVRGDMALIGPRPEIPDFVDMRDPVWNTVLSVRPGITDVASISFIDEEKLLASSADPMLCYRQVILPAKLTLNVSYLQARTFWRDLKLILLTIRYSLVRGKFDPKSMGIAVLAGRQ